MSSSYFFEKTDGSLHTHLELDPNPSPNWSFKRCIFINRTIPKYNSGTLSPGKNIVTDFLRDTISSATTTVKILYIEEADLQNLLLIFKEPTFKYSDGVITWTVTLAEGGFEYNIIRGLDIYEGSVTLRKAI